MDNQRMIPSALRHIALLAAIAVGFAPGVAQPVSGAQTEPVDLVIYGGTSAGIAAAVQAKRMGLSTVVIEPGRRIGGLTTGGLGQTDIGNKGVIGGISREFYQDVRKHYSDDANWKFQERDEYMEKSRINRHSATDPGEDAMWTFEPSAALAIFERWVVENEIPVVYGERLKREGEGRTVRRDTGWPVAEPGSISEGVEMKDGRIVAIVMESGKRFEGRYFMDASYEGDLMAGAGVSFTIGREGFEIYGETLNGVQAGRQSHQLVGGIDPYIEPGNPESGLLPWIDPEGPGEQGSSDHRIQAYCFRMCLTDHPDNRIPFHKPEGYEEINYELLFRNYEGGAPVRPNWINSRMPNRKTDTNNWGGFGSNVIGASYNFPEGSYAEREAISAAQRLHQQGFMWTMANHPRVPEEVRKEVSRWGMTKDEFVEGNGWQDQIYVRVARRLLSDYVMTQHNCQGREYAEDSVGMAAYTMDSHHTQRYITPEGFVQNEGDVQVGGFPPYPISYRSIIPRKVECTNLSVPVMVSASHIAFGSIRMEPVFMILAQSAATATAHAVAAGNIALQDVDYPALRERLKTDGQVLEIAKERRVTLPLAAATPASPASRLLPLNQIAGIVVDVSTARLDGPWVASRVPAGVHQGYFHDDNTAKGQCTATFTATLPAPGRYRVDVAWHALGNRAAQVPVTVSHADGQTGQRIDQRVAGGLDRYFTTIGTFLFGSTGTVTIGNSETEGHVIADAVRWLPVE